MDLDTEREKWLFSRRKRNLTLEDIQELSTAMYGDHTTFSLYGYSPGKFFNKGLKLTGRMAIECCLDKDANILANDLLEYMQKIINIDNLLLVDLFLGSGNLLYTMSQSFSKCETIGFENDNDVYNITKSNLNLIDNSINIEFDTYGNFHKYIENKHHRDTIFIICPPWGNGFSYENGLALDNTTPPVHDIISTVCTQYAGNNVYFCVAIYKNTVKETIDTLKLNFKFCYNSFDNHSFNSSLGWLVLH